MTDTPTLDRIAAAFDQARDLSARWPTDHLIVWLYAATYPSGRVGYWTRFEAKPRTEIDGLKVVALAGFRNGRQVYPSREETER